MTTSLMRIGAGCAVAAGGVVVAFEAVNLALGYPETGTGDAVVSTGYALWLPLTVLGLVGVYLAQEKRIGRVGLVGFLLAVVGTMALGGIYVSDLVLGPPIQQRAPEIFDEPTTTMLAVLFSGAACFVAGHLIFAAATLRARVLPRPAAGLYLAGAVVGIAAVISLPGTTVLLHASLAWLGLAVLRRPALPPAHREEQLQTA